MVFKKVQPMEEFQLLGFLKTSLLMFSKGLLFRYYKPLHLRWYPFSTM